MKTKKDGVEKAFERYKQEDVDLILSLTPTKKNSKNLSKALGRTQNAIKLIYKLAYSNRWLKKRDKQFSEGQKNIVKKITASKKKLGIFLGYGR